MAKNRVKGITIELDIDGSKLNSELKRIDTQLKSTEANLKDVNKLLKLDPKNTELLKQKQEFLNTSIKDTSERLKVLKQAYEQLDGQETEEAKEQQKLLAREISETESKLKSLKDQAKDFGSVMTQQLKSVGNDLKEVGNKISGVGKELSMKVTTPIVAMFSVATKSASDYTENLNKMEVAFGDYADEVREFTDSAYADYGLSKVDASANASLFGAMAKGIGFAEEEASSMSIQLTKLSSDLASYFNTDVESSATALQSIFTGNAQALKQYGVVMTDVNLKEFAQTLGITAKQYEKLGAQDKAMLRFQYVMSQTADAQGDFARTNQDFANAQRTLSASISDLSVSLGTQLLPIINPIITQITDFVHRLSEANPQIFEIIAKVGLFIATIGPVLIIIGTLISSIGTIVSSIGGLIGVVSTIVAILGGPVTIVLGILGGAILLILTNLDAVKKGFKQFANQFKRDWNTLTTNITNLINAFVEFFKTTWENIKTIFSTALNVLSTIAQTKINAVKTIIQTALDVIKGIFSTFGSLIQGDFSGALEGLKITGGILLDGLKSVVDTKLNAIKTLFSTIFEGAKKVVETQLDAIKRLFNFEWQLPKLKLPHFRNVGNTGPLGLPKIEVDWYAKAMKKGMILEGATIFGMKDGKLLGGGEKGSETIVGTNSLMGMIQKAVGTNGMTINMSVQGGNISANELANIVIDKLTDTIQRNNNRW